MQQVNQKGLVDLLISRISPDVRRCSHNNIIVQIRFLLITIFTICFSLFNQLEAQEPLHGANGGSSISGTVKVFQTNRPLAGATLKIGELITESDKDGKFSLNGPFKTNKLVISHLGYKDTILSISAANNILQVFMIPLDNQIEEVEVVSTGYQTIPKERTTGSFAYVDAKTMQRNPGMGLLSRLNGVANGLLIDRNTGNPDGISVRGRSTIFSSTRPLIVVDNFPYEGDLDNINPNDIESVTVLKDATAASIWGVRSGNGVIVITTKKAKDRLAVEYSSNMLFRKKPDLFTEKWMSPSDYIDSEIWLYNQGYYNGTINVPYQEISPILSLLEQVKSGKINEQEGNKRINEYRTHDVRTDLGKYFYRNLFQHQQQVSVSALAPSVRNILSAGYDQSLSDKVGSDNNRLNIRNSNQWTVLKDRITLNSEVWYTENNSNNKNTFSYTPKYPYERLVDNNGNALEASRSNSLRREYTDTVGNGQLLDWKYRPLDELRNGLSPSNLKDQQLRMQLSLQSNLYRSFKLGVNYLKSNNWMQSTTLYDQSSFYTRDLINQYSAIDPANNTVTRPLPLGDILNRNTTQKVSQYGRVQLDWNESLGVKHIISGLLGMEWRQDRSQFEDYGSLYGYNRQLENFTPVDIFSYFPLYHKGSYTKISNGGSRSRYVDNNRSLYGLISYTYLDNLTVNGSIRKDVSNIFGVNANQKGVPLWSVGSAYSFQNLLAWEKLDLLKLRFTYGYNGNVDKNTTAFLTSKLYRNMNLWGKPIDIILNPPNNTLRWERVQNMNVGLDFSLYKNRFSGSIEYFIKNGKDLMGQSSLAPQTGVTEFYGNVACTSTKGVDVQIKSVWMDKRDFRWQSDIIFNMVKDKVTDYYIEPGTNTDIVASFDIIPLIGSPINSLILFRSKGLNGAGDPVGFLEGEESTDYGKILNGMDRRSIITMGSRVPTRFGSLKNSFSFRDLELSFQILYKWGHYVKQGNSFNSDGLISGSYRFADYENRWQNPVDEDITDVPAFMYPFNYNRQAFYQSSDVLAIKGGMARLQDIRLAYSMNPLKKNPGSSLQLYLYASNLGLIWKQNNKGLNPDLISGYQVPVEWSLGFKFNY